MEADTAGTIVTAVGWTSVVVLNIIIFVTSRKDKLRERLDKLRDQLDKLSERVGAVEQRVSHIEGQLSPAPAINTSPLRLTGYGEEIATAIDATAWVGRHAESLRYQVRGKLPYEVDEIARGFVNDYEFTPYMRNAIYEHGYLDDHVRTVLGILLRDELLRERSGDAKAS